LINFFDFFLTKLAAEKSDEKGEEKEGDTMAAELLGGIRHVLESGVHKIRQGFQIRITDPICMVG
jgi:hypothetical protein